MNDEHLRDLLHDAVADVEPSRDLDLSAASSRPRAHWLPVTVAAALATVLVVTGTAWLVGDRAETPPAAAPSRTPLVVWEVVTTAAGFRLSSDRRVEATSDPLQAAVEDTLATFLPGADVDVSVSDGSRGVVVDLAADGARALGDEPASPPELVPQAIAWAVASATGTTDPVRLTVDGSSEVRWFDTDLARPVAPDPTVLAPVTVDSVGNGETVSSPFTVSGLASTFEGTVTWKLVRQEQTVRRGFATAELGGTPSPYSFTVTAPPGSYTLEVRETDPSDGEGAKPFGVVRTVVVR